jgi:pimeloyl-ACP methyl ester carboxylesterase
MERIAVRGVELAYQRSGGELPSFIWGHGLTSSVSRELLFSMLDWSRVERIADVVLYDARGHGESESTPDESAYDWHELALDQLALADGLGIDRYVAGGASMGCATALIAALAAPQRVRALVLALPPTAWATREAQQTAYFRTAELVERGEFDTLIAEARATPPPDPFQDIPQWADGVASTYVDVDAVRLVRVLRGAAHTDFPAPEEIATITVPTLILAWTGDSGHPMSTAERLAELIPGAQLRRAGTIHDVLGWTDAALELLGALGGAGQTSAVSGIVRSAPADSSAIAGTGSGSRKRDSSAASNS